MESVLMKGAVSCTEWTCVLLCLDGVVVTVAITHIPTIANTVPTPKHMTHSLHTTPLTTRTWSSFFLESRTNGTFDIPRPSYTLHFSSNPTE